MPMPSTTQGLSHGTRVAGRLRPLLQSVGLLCVLLSGGLSGCAAAESSPMPPEPALVIETDEVPATPAGEWLARVIAIGNREQPLPDVEDMPEVFAPVVLERQTWTEARAALEFIPNAGPYTLLGFVSEPQEHQLQALVQRRTGRVLVELIVEPTGAHRIQRVRVTPLRAGSR